MMNDEMKYNAVLKELGEVLQEKNTTITCQKWQIDNLKEKLAAAEKERDDTLHDFLEADRHCDAASEAFAQLHAINKALRKCVNVEARAVIDFDGLFDLQADIQAALQQAEGGAA